MLGPFRGGRVDAVSGVPGGRTSSTSAPSTAASGRRSMPVGSGFRCSTPSRSRRLARSRSRRPRPTRSTSAAASRRCATRSATATACTSRSTPGKTWTHIGLDNTQHIGKVAVDPKNANVVFVAAIGHLYEAHPDRGVFRSRDGGKTWQKVLFKNNDVGAVDVVIDPVNSQVVYAALWNTRRPPWYTYQPSNGPGGGIFKSTDGGSTWKQLAGGLPTECVGRVGHRRGAEQSAARVRSRRRFPSRRVRRPNTPCPGAPPGRGGGAGAAGAGARRRTRRGGSDAVAAGRLLSIRRCRGDVDEVVRATPRCGDAAGISSTSPSIPRNADIVYVPNVVAIAIEGRRQDMGGAARLARRRRLPGRLGVARRLEHDDRRERSGNDHHTQCDDRRSARRHLEFVAESADRADLSHLGRLPHCRTGSPARSRTAARSPSAREASSQPSRCATGNRSALAARAA